MTFRFDDRKVLEPLLWELVSTGADLEDLDVRLSRVGPVDLDLLEACLADACEAWRQLTVYAPAQAA